MTTDFDELMLKLETPCTPSYRWAWTYDLGHMCFFSDKDDHSDAIEGCLAAILDPDIYDHCFLRAVGDVMDGEELRDFRSHKHCRVYMDEYVIEADAIRKAAEGEVSE